ncbi:MAG TPA: tripartite tricarboxylate transporter substrate binding protein, partial [Burkholderiales bacterium]|nr:tripartite tricarboxylate transporter substrate binding protein [Burkholderiales bacterium]
MTSPIRARLPRLFALAALAILPWLGGPALAQAWPAKPVRIVFPYSAGGPVDVLLRALAMRMSESMGQQFVVENRMGANEIIAAEAVARSAPDAYTLIFASDAVFSLNPQLYSKLPYDANRDFAPVARVINAYLMLVGRTDLPPKDLKELFAYVKANNGKISYGSVGLGSVNHLSMSWLANQQGLEMIHVPFKGVGPMVQEIAANRLDLAFAVV